MERTVAQGATRLGEPEVFRVFYADALPRVFGYFYTRCGADIAVAEDLTQETFLAAVSELKQDRTVVAPMPWIIGIARHKWLDHIRRQRRSGWFVVSWEEGALDTLVVEPEIGEVSSGRAIAALAAVPSPQREALVLRYLDGYSVAEIGTALGRSVEAAESLLARGRVGFRRAYREVGDGI